MTARPTVLVVDDHPAALMRAKVTGAAGVNIDWTAHFVVL